jgi:alanine racemase
MRYSDSALPAIIHTVAEIDLSALLYNLGQVKKCIRPDCRVLAVVKANAYGHGALPVARTLVSAGASMLAVAWVQEGIELRRAGVRVPILVMGGATEEECGAVLAHRLTTAVYQPAQILTLEKSAKKKNRKVKVHIKIDTGMGRLGAPSTKEMSELIDALRRSSHVVAEGIMTHMAEDGIEDRSFTQLQLSLFKKATDLLKREAIPVAFKHAANSAMTIDVQQAHFNMVRPGIILYGYLPSNSLSHPIELRPVMTLKTRILQLKRVPKGATISYGRTFTTRRESLIATLPVGYADGIPRALSDKGHVLVRSRRAPIVGRICMDMMMVDFTDHGNVQEGEEVILMGREGQEKITADEIGEKTGTIAYEILCGIGPRVSRIYIKGPKQIQ